MLDQNSSVGVMALACAACNYELDVLAGKLQGREDVARSIVFLTSPVLAGHLSGTILPIAGGMEGRWLHRDSA